MSDPPSNDQQDRKDNDTPEDVFFDFDSKNEDDSGWETDSEEADASEHRPHLKKTMKRIGQKIGNAALKVGAKFSHVGSKLGDTLGKVGDKVGEGLNAALGSVTKASQKISDSLGKVGEKVGEGISQAKARIDDLGHDRRQFQEEVAKEMAKMNAASEQPAPKGEEWADISAQRFSIQLETQFQTEEEAAVALMTIDMRAAYNEARNAVKDGQESTAASYYDFIIQQAESKQFPAVKQYILQKKSALFK